MQDSDCDSLRQFLFEMKLNLETTKLIPARIKNQGKLQKTSGLATLSLQFTRSKGSVRLFPMPRGERDSNRNLAFLEPIKVLRQKSIRGIKRKSTDLSSSS